ncbi:Protein EARLY RESPONSIVE TO DEHYDRATION 15 [Senna tora]|uniref:Protein EARLY RESPONSIVE TO DEHYDRATION 15 n=1 Tax=Senna tora TaxID=362788 RepID=A0A834TD58_9FABA|nr:Protein EARLY RESPONSIVE TO DEHYDRATION 15 [Senna tora]
MALVSGGRSTLNPNAPIYIPAAFRQVEDFSPEWWQLVTTLTWYHDYWLSQQQDEGGYYNNAEDEFDSSDVLDLLPDTFDLDADDDLSLMEAQLEEFIQSSQTQGETGSNSLVKTEHGATAPTA